jgi:nitrite reductase/ring-hydroxylating ferredoxin subunit
MSTRLGSLADLSPQGSARFHLPDQPLSNGLCVISQGEQVYGYLNSCPHTGGPMDWVPGQFLNAEGDLIQCSLHGALFRIHDGHCVHGPCAGSRLTPVKLSCKGNDIYLENAS